MNPVSREEMVHNLGSTNFDLLIIGGGINGAGVARDAAMRGWKVALIEAGDFCSGTSSKSSKMFHGGIRYLEQLHFSLVFEASHERKIHAENLCPHLAKSVPFMIPVYPWSPHPKWKVALGVFLYDALALFKNHGTRSLTPQMIQAEEPNLEQQGLRGAVVYHDVVMDDVRVGLEVLRSARFHGATTLNYLSLDSFEKNKRGELIGAVAKDRLQENASPFLIKAKAIVNLTGPWSDRVRALADPTITPYIRPTKGVHLILPDQSLGKASGFVLTAKQDNRVFFSIPWFGRTLVGTTDTDYKPELDGPLENIEATGNDVDYLLEGVKRTFPHATVGKDQILSTIAGLRPLVSQGDAANPSAVSREHRIWRDKSGLFNMAGGKYTTYRTMAQELVNTVAKEVGSEFSVHSNPSGFSTGDEPIVWSDKKAGDALRGTQANYESTLGSEVVANLQARYGIRWQEVADLAMEDSGLRAKVISGQPEIYAELKYFKNVEMAHTFADVLRRRTMMALRVPLANHWDEVKKAADYWGENNFTKQQLSTIQGKSF